MMHRPYGHMAYMAIWHIAYVRGVYPRKKNVRVKPLNHSGTSATIVKPLNHSGTSATVVRRRQDSNLRRRSLFDF